MNASALSIAFAPLLPYPVIYGMAVAALLFILLSLFFYRRGALARLVCAAGFLLLFLNPSIVEEQRAPAADVAVIAVDRSPSQHNGKRADRTQAALEGLTAALQSRAGLDVRVVESSGTGAERETLLFDGIDKILADVPAARRAGLILLTDGQVHDIPDASRAPDYGPVNLLLSGEKNERDRRLVILEAPSYGIVGQDAAIRYRIEDSNADSGDSATLVLRQDNAPALTDTVPVNRDLEVRVKIAHAGQNIFDMETAPLDGEITAANNRVPVIVNGVRDRLKVLLVSGQPYAGGRTWRDMLTSDPGVDLVHFTILREPDKLDATPQNELSLIAFPFDELFQVKLYDFDLIIFDRYRVNRILPNYYFGNIAAYVKKGGALLEASGPSFATEDSIYNTELGQVLPAHPAGVVLEQPFRPVINDKGHRHPVTQNLGDENWGRWLRQVAVMPDSGEVLMTGANDRPLLILDHVGEGRVAQLASDQIWLWSRGFEGGGPQAELLRRLAHWLMKEPELEENALDVSVENGMLLIRRRSLEESAMTVLLTKPDGARSSVELKQGGDGVLQARVPATDLGVYIVSDGRRERFALVGDINPPELSGVRTTPDLLAPLVSASKGGVTWLADTPKPDLRFLPPGRNSYGNAGTIGLRSNGSYTVNGMKTTPALPAWAWAAGLLALIIGSWWIEGRARR